MTLLVMRVLILVLVAWAEGPLLEPRVLEYVPTWRAAVIHLATLEVFRPVSSPQIEALIEVENV